MVRGVFRWGTLCGVFAMLMFVTGCPLLDPCSNNPCDDGLFCNGTETCTVEEGEAVCADGDAVACDAGDVCDEDTDECITPDDPCDALDCDDSDECTDDSCVDGACVNDNNTAACDDGDACTEGDVCSDGTCAGTAMDCDDGEACTDDTCADGVCVNDDIVCDAGETCVDGVCTAVCAVDADCDDSDACTTDTCVAEACSNVAMDCDDELVCTDDSCDAGACVNAAVTCAEGEICVEPDGCTTAVVCAVDADCNDNDLCTTDSCGADLFCDFDAVVCDDADACTTDACDPADGTCAFTAIACDPGEACVDGDCLPTEEFEFTLDDDTLNGSAGDDVFTAGVGTLNPDDIAVGNGGNDVVNASIVGSGSDLATLIQMTTVNFTTLNDATFDAAMCAAIGTYAVTGASAGNLVLTNAETGVGLAMGAAFADMLSVDFSGAGAAYTLTLNGSADGASFDCVDAALDTDLVVSADSFLGCGVPGTDCFGGAGSVTVSGAGNLTLTGAQGGAANDLAADGGAYDMDDFTGTLTVVPAVDIAENHDFSAGGADELEGVDQVTIIDTETYARTLTFDTDDGDVTVDISEIDADDSAGALTVVQGAENDDILTLILGGDGDGMGALTAATSEFVNIVSGGTTANAIANVTSETGTAFVTEAVTLTGTQDCDLGTVTSEIFDSTGLAIGADATLTCGATMQVDTGGGDDDITGSAAVDLIDGGAGDDTITGAGGADIMTGGADSDTFQFDATGDSGITRALADDILDFVAGADGDVMAFDDTGGFALSGAADTLAFEIESDGAFAAGTNVFVIDTTVIADLFGDLTQTETDLDGLVNAGAGAGGGIFVVYDATTDAVYAVFDDDVTADSTTGADLTLIVEMGLDGAAIADSGIVDLLEENFTVLP